MVTTQPATLPEALEPLGQAAPRAMAHFTQRATHSPPHPSPAPTPVPQRQETTSQCLLPLTRRAPTATGMEMRKRRCWPKVRMKAREEESTLCTAQLTLAQWRVDRFIIIMVSNDVESWNPLLQSNENFLSLPTVLILIYNVSLATFMPCCNILF